MLSFSDDVFSTRIGIKSRLKEKSFVRIFLLDFIFAMPGSISSDGSIYNASGIRLGQINSDGTVYNATYTSLGQIERDGTVRNSMGMMAGKIEDDGTVRDSRFITIGKVDNNGTVRDSSFMTLCQIYNAPSAIWVAAAYFFFDFDLS